uniref:Putative molybdopterin-guanine dinucleotide synthase protein A MobA n=2 Tax=root TaxID=1 RepID=E6PNG1_9ZZZZ
MDAQQKHGSTTTPMTSPLTGASTLLASGIPAEVLTGLILAGGRASRMGGLDKGLQPFRSTPLIQHVLENLKPQVGQVLISANRNLTAYRRFGVPVLTDADPAAFDGPLAGILAGLQHCKTRYVLVVPCDSPRLPENFAPSMARCLEASQADFVMARMAGRTNPVMSLMHVRLQDSLQAFLHAGGRSVLGWADGLKTAVVDFEGDAAIWNLNTLDDLRRAESGPDQVSSGMAHNGQVGDLSPWTSP